ncbi:MAG: MBL fold metallo-hydrolase [Peptostreptococcaceae bacterium]
MGRKKKYDCFTITQYQPNDCVTSSSIMVEVDGLKLLFDLGLMQDSSLQFQQLYHKNMEKLKSIPYDELDYVFCSHFHYDHSSAIPILNREETGFNGVVITTELTAALGKKIMEDAQCINQSDVDKRILYSKDKKDKTKYRTFYDKNDVEDVFDYVRCYGYNQEVRLSDTVSVELLPACHASGACMFYVTYRDDTKVRRLLYTGDITYGQKVDRPFTMNIQNKCLKVDYLVLESTYGLRDKKVYTNEHPKDFIERVIIEEVVRKNNTLWIPSFAIHRSTALCYYLNQIFNNNEEIRKANIPIYFCGKMLKEAHEIIGKDKYNEYYDEFWHDKKEIFKHGKFNFLTTKQDVEHFCLNNTRKIVISSAGMYDKGYSALLAESYIANKKISTLACGYQGESTLGWHIREGTPFVNFNGIGRNVRLKYCGTIPELSGHANHEGLISFVKSLNQTTLKEIILVHGDQDAKEELKEDLEVVLSKNKKVHIIKQFETLKF